MKWSDMDAAARRAPSSLTGDMIPLGPGVYAWYRGGSRMYIGKAVSLRARLWGNHLAQSAGLSGSAFRRNVAEHLGYGSSKDIKSGKIVLTAEQLAAVRAWIMGCEVAWLTCASGAEAIGLESSLKAEFKPHLTKA